MDSKTIVGGLAVDNRGIVTFVNDFNFEGVKRFYQVENHRLGFIRAWHAHKKEAKYIYVTRGTFLVGIVDLDTNEVKQFVMSSNKPSVLFVPPNHANGFMNLTDSGSIMFFSTSTLEESLVDDIRYPYDKWDIWKIDYR
jgi:dTDP-4-dehydrorhamnose 3,5-epimerase